jgi:hypothetical protein
MAKRKESKPRTPDYEKAEEIRLRLAAGSLSLRGVAEALRRLENDLYDDDRGNDAVIVRLLEHAVEAEADAMGEAEAFLNGLHMRTPRTKAAA